MIKYLDFALCDKQHNMCEELLSLAAQVRMSQTELQANECSLQDAMTGLLSYAQNPTKSEVYETTVEALDEALATAQQDQQELLRQALTTAKKICALYESEELSPAAQYCMSLYNLFLDIINPFLYPFKYSKTQLDKKHSGIDAKMKRFSGMLLSNNLGLNFQPILKAGTCISLRFIQLIFKLNFFGSLTGLSLLVQCKNENIPTR